MKPSEVQGWQSRHFNQCGCCPQVPEGAGAEAGHSVQAVVLDVNKRDGVVDLSLLPALLDLCAKAQQRAQQGAGGRKKRRKTEQGAEATTTAVGGAGLQQGQELQCQVQLVGGHPNSGRQWLGPAGLSTVCD